MYLPGEPVLERRPRHMLKFIYYRTTAPSPPLSPFTAGRLAAGGFSRGAAALACWLAGAESRDIGGQGWPNWSPNQIVPTYGAPRPRL